MKKNHWIFGLWFIVFMATACSGAGGDDDDDQVADDDDNDAVDDDDAVDADDDTVDDDDNDDDSAGPDPLAVVDCDAACLSPGDTLNVTGHESSDPRELPLSFYIDFGDGTIVTDVEAEHPYDASGAYQVTLTATNSVGASDVSSCIVSVGVLPKGPGTLDEIAFRPHYYDERIFEPSNPRPTVGGMVWGFFNAPADATVTDILVNGVSWSAPTGLANWCEVTPPVLAAGDIGIVRCSTTDAAIIDGAQISLQVETDAGTVWTRQSTIETEPAAISYVTGRPDGSEMLIYVRNDAASEPIEIIGLLLNGQNVSDFAIVDEPIIESGRTAAIRVPTCDGIAWGERMVVTVLYEIGGAKAARRITRELRLFPQKFLVGNWNGDDVFTDPAWRQTQRNAGINMFIWSPSVTFPPEVILPLAEEEDFYVFTHADNPYPDYIDAAENWGDNPRWYMNAVAGEPEIGGRLFPDVLESLQAQMDLFGPDKQMWIYNACSNVFGQWGSMADVGGMDHYCVWAPKCNYNPPFWYWDHIEFAGYYTLVAKRAAEPRPIINWSQGIDNAFEINGIQFRCNTPEEIRSQWYQNVGWGAKALPYYHFLQEHDAACPEEPEQEMGVLSKETDQFSDLLGIGEMAGNTAFAWSEDQQVDVVTTISPDGLVLIVSNLDYDLNILIPFEWREKTNVEIVIDPPAGFEPQSAWSPEGEDAVPLEIVKQSGGFYTVTIPSLPVARALIIEPEP